MPLCVLRPGAIRPAILEKASVTVYTGHKRLIVKSQKGVRTIYRIGIDLGGTNMVVGAVDEAGMPAAVLSVPTRRQLSPAALLDDVARCVQDCLASAGLSLADCAGLGIGCPGSCDTAAGLVRRAPNLNWTDVPVRRLLRERLGLPVALANDADCAALGEALFGAARGHSSALLITLGTGVGGGLVLDGNIYAGHRGLGGEFGHMCIIPDGVRCGCGQAGCWEAYASATALVRQASEAAAHHPGSLLNALPVLDGKAVYAAASAGDAAAMAVTAQYAGYVALGLANLINALAPEIVLLGGGVAGAGAALLDPVRAGVQARFFHRNPALLPEILPAALGGDAGYRGAAALCSTQW